MLNQDFKEFFESLNASSVRYLLVGGYAVAFHGRPRSTKDINVWTEPGEENGVLMQNASIRLLGSVRPTVESSCGEGRTGWNAVPAQVLRTWNAVCLQPWRN